MNVGSGRGLVSVAAGKASVGVAVGSLGCAEGELVGAAAAGSVAVGRGVGVALVRGVREGVAVATTGKVALPCDTASVDSQAS